VLANLADTGNSSDGSARVGTGNALAIGNRTNDRVIQAVNVGITDVTPAPTPAVPAESVPAPASSPAEELPVTGAPFAAQTALGLLLVSIGTVLRKKAQMA
jgi:hypothetical protein